MGTRLVRLTVLLMSLAGAAAAQTAPPSEQPASATPAPAAAPSVDVSRLPVNVSRLQRQLQRTAIREERDGLRLRYTIDVFGQAPPIKFLPPDANLAFGPVPYGAPTHAELLRQITPQEYRAPAADFSGLFRWLDKSK
jgi:hypothetical protein